MQSTIVTNENEKTTTITGYEAELIKLLAERARKTPQEFVLSFFEKRCNALCAADGVRRLNGHRRVSFFR